MDNDFFAIGIKNMVCPRCITAVQVGLERISVQFNQVKLGSAIIHRQSSLKQIEEMLLDLGFELLTTNDQKLVENIKTQIIFFIQTNQFLNNENLSTWLSKTIGKEYHALSILFSETEGVTIERYFIKLRLEKVKELLVYNELSLKEISYQLGFSSVSHLSAQFKKETGFTTSRFKEIGASKRVFIDKI